MCIKYQINKLFNQDPLNEVNTDKDDYELKYSKSFKSILIENKNELIDNQKLEKLIGIKTGIEKIISLEERVNSINIISEKTEDYDLSKSFNSLEIANLGIRIINNLKTLYKIGIKDFKLSNQSLCLNKENKLVIKNSYFYSEDSNHILQLANLLNEVSQKIDLNQEKEETVSQLKKIIDKYIYLSNLINIDEFKQDLTYFIQLYTPFSSINIADTNPYSSMEKKKINNTCKKYNSFLNQIKSEKIINFNFNLANSRDFVSYKWLFEIEEKINTQKSYHYHNKGINIKEILFFKKDYSGIVIVNRVLHLFVYNGQINGAVNTSNFLINDQAIQSIDFVSYVEFKDNQFLPVIISSITSSGVPMIEQNEYSSKELINTLENISHTAFNGYIQIEYDLNIIYLAYEKGNNIFNIIEKDKNSSLINIQALIKMVFNYKGIIKVNVYNLRLSISDYSLEKILLSTDINIEKISMKNGCLNDILKLGKEHLPAKLKESTIKNISITKNISIPEKIELFNGELDISLLIEENINYKFIQWLLFEVFFKIRENNSGHFIELYNLIPLVNKVTFTEFNNNIRISFKKDDLVLAIAQTGDSKLENFNKFIKDVNNIKSEINNKELLTAIYISDKIFNEEVISRYKELTRVKSFNILKLKNKQRNYVRISRGVGYNLFLIEQQDQSFKLSYPSLNEHI